MILDHGGCNQKPLFWHWRAFSFYCVTRFHDTLLSTSLPGPFAGLPACWVCRLNVLAGQWLLPYEHKRCHFVETHHHTILDISHPYLAELLAHSRDWDGALLRSNSGPKHMKVRQQPLRGPKINRHWSFLTLQLTICESLELSTSYIYIYMWYYMMLLDVIIVFRVILLGDLHGTSVLFLFAMLDACPWGQWDIEAFHAFHRNFWSRSLPIWRIVQSIARLAMYLEHEFPCWIQRILLLRLGWSESFNFLGERILPNIENCATAMGAHTEKQYILSSSARFTLRNHSDRKCLPTFCQGVMISLYASLCHFHLQSQSL